MTAPPPQSLEPSAGPAVPPPQGPGVLVPHGTALPPPPPGVRHVSLPLVGVVIATDRRRRRVDRFFYWPMIVLALAMLPLLAIEILRPPAHGHWLRVVINAGFAIIWAAFLVEFLVKIAIAECRVEYVRRNWLDVIIILVPVVRPLRAAAVVRTARAFKLRGIAMKLVTIVIGMEATDRLLHRVGLKRQREAKRPRDMTRHEMRREILRLRDLTERWEGWHARHEEHIARHGGPCLPEAPPDLDAGAETGPDAS